MTNDSPLRAGTRTSRAGLLLVALMVGAAVVVAARSTAQAPAAASALDTSRAAAPAAATAGLRVLSWNVSNDAFVRDPDAFRALMRKARPDVLLLDEVAPQTTEAQLRKALAGLDAGDATHWYIDTGRSGGRQRNVIASRLPLQPLTEFAEQIAYPRLAREHLARRMRAANAAATIASMDDGIAVNGAVVQAGSRRLLVVSLDLQCCGNDPGSWEEERRSVETAEIRRRIQQALRRTRVDAVVVAGDFNLVGTAVPLVIASGPYPAPHGGLIAAELYQLGDRETWTWTWDGRGERFPDRAMDFMLYSPQSLALDEGYVLDSEDLSPAELAGLGLERDAVNRLSDHRPLVAQFRWQ